jgi:hypothetical protein
MSRHLHGRIMAAAIAVPLVMTLAACSDNDKDKANSAAKAACPANISQTASTQLPGDVPSPGGNAYDYSNQGKTRVWFFAIAGSADQLPQLRDSYDSQLTGKGYKIDGTDQEEGAEAESDFGGPHEGTTNFRPLCTGKVVLRIKLTS